MMPRPIVNVRLLPLLLVPLSALVAATPRTGLAYDWATRAAWHRTWHAPDALNTPLRQYFIPRWPGRCDRAAYADGYEYVDSIDHPAHVQSGVYFMAPCQASAPPPACTACLGVRSERLGQIPNDLDADTAVAGGAPGR